MSQAFEIFCDPTKENRFKFKHKSSHNSPPFKKHCSKDVRKPLQPIFIKNKTNTLSPIKKKIVINSDSDDLSSINSSFQSEPEDQFLYGDSFFQYSPEIWKCLRETELRIKPKTEYMRKQMDLTHRKRSTVVDWMVDVCEEFKSSPEVISTAVQYLDRFLSIMSVHASKLQKVATTCLWLAFKFEEVDTPHLNNLTYFTDNSCSPNDVIILERLILETLKFDMIGCTPLHFLKQLLHFHKTSTRVSNFALYLCESSLLDGHHFLHHLPSLVASCCLFMSQKLNHIFPWDDRLTKFTGYSTEEMTNCLDDVLHLHHMYPKPSFSSVYRKYKPFLSSFSSPTSSSSTDFLSPPSPSHS